LSISILRDRPANFCNYMIFNNLQQEKSFWRFSQLYDNQRVTTISKKA
jgi:hypothetical protein